MLKAGTQVCRLRLKTFGQVSTSSVLASLSLPVRALRMLPPRIGRVTSCSSVDQEVLKSSRFDRVLAMLSCSQGQQFPAKSPTFDLANVLPLPPQSGVQSEPEPRVHLVAILGLASATEQLLRGLKSGGSNTTPAVNAHEQLKQLVNATLVGSEARSTGKCGAAGQDSPSEALTEAWLPWLLAAIAAVLSSELAAAPEQRVVGTEGHAPSCTPRRRATEFPRALRLTEHIEFTRLPEAVRVLYSRAAFWLRGAVRELCSASPVCFLHALLPAAIDRNPWTVRVYVRRGTSLVELRLNGVQTVRDLKMKLAMRLRLPVAAISLSAGGKALADSEAAPQSCLIESTLNTQRATRGLRAVANSAVRHRLGGLPIGATAKPRRSPAPRAERCARDGININKCDMDQSDGPETAGSDAAACFEGQPRANDNLPTLPPQTVHLRIRLQEECKALVVERAVTVGDLKEKLVSVGLERGSFYLRHGVNVLVEDHASVPRDSRPETPIEVLFRLRGGGGGLSKDRVKNWRPSRDRGAGASGEAVPAQAAERPHDASPRPTPSSEDRLAEALEASLMRERASEEQLRAVQEQLRATQAQLANSLAQLACRASEVPVPSPPRRSAAAGVVWKQLFESLDSYEAESVDMDDFEQQISAAASRGERRRLRLADSETYQRKRDAGKHLNLEEFTCVMEELRVAALMRVCGSLNLSRMIAENMTKATKPTLENAFNPLADVASRREPDEVTRSRIIGDAVVEGILKAIDNEDEYYADNDPFELRQQFQFGSRAFAQKGLHHLLGSPDPLVLRGMEREHLEDDGAGEEFEAYFGGRVLRTTPAEQWRLVLPLGVDGPVNPWCYNGRERLCDSDDMMQHPKVKEANLSKAEVVSLRLNTGPMWRRYNRWLRQTVDELIQRMRARTEARQLTGIEEEKALDEEIAAMHLAMADKDSGFVSTILALDSCVKKLARIAPLPPSGSVFRGFSGMCEPEILLKENGCCVDSATMSVCNRELALLYSVSHKGGPGCLNLRLGALSSAPSIAWISYFPEEAENERFLPALTALENDGEASYVRTPNGIVKEFPVRVHVNQKGRSVEDFEAERKSMLLQLADTAMIEIKSTLRKEGLREHELGQAILAQCQEVKTAYRQRGINYFNDNSNFSYAIQDVLALPPWTVALLRLRTAEMAFDKELMLLQLQDWLPSKKRDDDSKAMADRAAALALCRQRQLVMNDVDSQDAQGRTALFKCAEEGQAEQVDLLLVCGARTEVKDGQGQTPLIVACQNGKEATIQKLVEMGADVNAKDGDGDTALLKACRIRLEATASMLVDKRADINAKNISGNTALIVASGKGLEETARILVDKRADVNAMNIYGNTALMEASKKGLESIARMLVQKGAKYDIENNLGENALKIARKMRNSCVVQILSPETKSDASRQALDDSEQTREGTSDEEEGSLLEEVQPGAAGGVAPETKVFFLAKTLTLHAGEDSSPASPPSAAPSTPGPPNLNAIKSKMVRGAVEDWRMRCFSGGKLIKEFSSIHTKKPGGLDRDELEAFLRRRSWKGTRQEALRVWKKEDVDELFSFLDVDKDGILSVLDFATAVMGEVRQQQLEQAINVVEVGKLIARAMPMASVQADGTIPQALSEAVVLSPIQVRDIVVKNVDEISQLVHANLGHHREALLSSQNKEQDGTTKFTFIFADTSGVETGSLSERLGLPSGDIEEAMRQEHASDEPWTTENYKLRTSPRQEWEFVDRPKNKTYPGEGTGHKMRRRQYPEKVWQKIHVQLPVAEALKTYKSELGVDWTELVGRVQKVLRAHRSANDMQTERIRKQLTTIVLQCAAGESRADADGCIDKVAELDIICQQIPDDVEHVKEKRRAVVEAQAASEAVQLHQLLAAWDLRLPEIQAIMAYTGPLFEKYNGVLRWLETIEGNIPYRNTILALISGIMKLKKRSIISKSRKVWRGLKDGELPPTWIFENNLGSRGGAEKAFMSTSTQWKEAAKYAMQGGNPVLLEIDLGEIDKGADVAELSQYPLEAEVLFPPMTNLEVLGSRLELHEGLAILVLLVRVNVSVRNETLDQMEAKRKAVFMPSLNNIVQEVERDLGSCPVLAKLEPELQQRIKCDVLKNCNDLVAQYESRAPEWYLVDQHYQLAVKAAAGLLQVAAAKARLTAKAVQESGATDQTLQVWQARPLGVVDANVLNERKKKWEEVRDGTSGLWAPHLVQNAALELADWQGIVDKDDLDMVMDLEGNTTLMLAAARGEVTDVAVLLGAGCSALIANKKGKTALHMAAEYGHAEAVTLLAEADSDIDATDQNNTATPLCIAALGGHVEVVRKLLAAGADKTVKTQFGTALQIAEDGLSEGMQFPSRAEELVQLLK